MRKRIAIAIVLVLSAAAVRAQNALPADVRGKIDSAVADVLKTTGAPSASVAVVRDGAIAYVHAYGLATIDPRQPSAPEMRYSIGSISKQFTAAAMLMLVEDGKVSLDDPVSRWLPELTRANEVTVRQILSMTSGYQDYWPQDYVMPPMLLPTTAQQILDGWAKKPLDFEPGTKWQYSNTNYVVAGAIVEKASGMPIMDFLRQRVFGPLKMQTVTNIDDTPRGPGAPTGYLRYALGPARPAPIEGKGWTFAAFELGMTASDLARWDISMIDQTVMKPESYRTMETEVRLTNGVGTGYGLGVQVGAPGGHRLISHSGEVSGFTAQNSVYPDDRTAIVVLTNIDASGASGQIASRIASALFALSDSETKAAVDQAKAIYDGLQHGRIDRSLFTSNCNAYFSAQALADFQSSLGSLGKPESFTQAGQGLRGGMVLRRFQIKYPKQTLALTTFTMPDGTIEQYQIAATD
ncbi:MAG TPA: serine hydrolase domain-containing protein [Vicinamibacterales bacterium]|nr:serine hydrolase domain-containing protein [Vicinamibacterales bacterium]